MNTVLNIGLIVLFVKMRLHPINVREGLTDVKAIFLIVYTVHNKGLIFVFLKMK